MPCPGSSDFPSIPRHVRTEEAAERTKRQLLINTIALAGKGGPLRLRLNNGWEIDGVIKKYDKDWGVIRIGDLGIPIADVKEIREI